MSFQEEFNKIQFDDSYIQGQHNVYIKNTLFHIMHSNHVTSKTEVIDNTTYKMKKYSNCLIGINEEIYGNCTRSLFDIDIICNSNIDFNIIEKLLKNYIALNCDESINKNYTKPEVILVILIDNGLMCGGINFGSSILIVTEDPRLCSNSKLKFLKLFTHEYMHSYIAYQLVDESYFNTGIKWIVEGFTELFAILFLGELISKDEFEYCLDLTTTVYINNKNRNKPYNKDIDNSRNSDYDQFVLGYVKGVIIGYYWLFVKQKKEYCRENFIEFFKGLINSRSDSDITKLFDKLFKDWKKDYQAYFIDGNNMILPTSNIEL